MCHARGVGGKAPIAGPFSAAGSITKFGKLPIVANRQNHVAISGRKVLVGHGVGVCIAHAARQLTAVEVVHALVREAGHLHIKQRQVDVLTFARGVACFQRRQNGGTGIQTGHEVCQRHAHFHGAGTWLIVAATRDAHQASHALDQKIVAGTVCVGSGLAKARDGAINQPGVQGPQGFGVQPIGFQSSKLEVFDDHITLHGQLANQGLSSGQRHVNRQRALVAVGAEVVSRLASGLALRVF